ncbi:yip1 domain-containing protein [Ditylenchus destructor]|uniref:Yip1 domain-containing protein n=1 Tax=Ditylenchus destructor TaxID=166010 RepID=A0AAD4R6U0_9BILA|nr:yip1 domain-containing protein [Ditylenchus destructor]
MEETDNKPAGQRRALRPGEWACVDAKCAYINAEKRTTCEICGKGKPRAKSRVGREIGKDAAEKSKGLFSAEDWVCTKCGNVNWARRSVCNVCNAPKLADLEVRTGYGGGYMDREDVEYIERDDDDEFDEFGRKKKKRRPDREYNSTETAQENMQEDIDDEAEPSKPHKDPLKYDENIEDEEDDEGDSDDLDKYDLTADPEIIAFTAKLEPNKEKISTNGENERPPSPMSSDCSCSCSGGECSCVESEEEEIRSKRIRGDREGSEKRRSPENDRHLKSDSRSGKSSRDRRDDRDYKSDRGERSHDHVRDHDDRGSRKDSRERERGRERDKSRERRRSRERHGERSRDRDHFNLPSESDSPFTSNSSKGNTNLQKPLGSSNSANLDGSSADAVGSKRPHFLSFEFYQRYFDVDTSQVQTRILNSMFPRRNSNFITDYIQPSPDLYGPFWISITLIFSIAICGNFGHYIQNSGLSKGYDSDFGLVTGSTTLVTSYVILVPFLIYSLLWYRKSSMQYSYMELLCAYGYSLSIFVPVSVLWLVQIHWFRWFLIIASVTLSGFVLANSLWPTIKGDSNRVLAVAFIGGVILLHVLLAVGFKAFYFDTAMPTDGHPIMQHELPLALQSTTIAPSLDNAQTVAPELKSNGVESPAKLPSAAALMMEKTGTVKKDGAVKKEDTTETNEAAKSATEAPEMKQTTISPAKVATKDDAKSPEADKNDVKPSKAETTNAST